jgi:hypothetical protein
MKTNNFNLCRECTHINSCVLTSQKEKVFSCSEFDEKAEVQEIYEPTVSQQAAPIEVPELEMAM